MPVQIRDGELALKDGLSAPIRWQAARIVPVPEGGLITVQAGQSPGPDIEVACTRLTSNDKAPTQNSIHTVGFNSAVIRSGRRVWNVYSHA